MTIRVGCTGWSYADWYKNKFYDRKEEEKFSHSGKSYPLWRYSQFFDCTEVNSFNYTITIMEPNELAKLEVPHQAVWWYKKQLDGMKEKDMFAMYNRVPFMTAKWSESTPSDFVFSAKVPGMITHAKCLRDCADETRLFLKGIRGVDNMKYLLYEFPSYFTKKHFFDDFKQYFSKMPDSHSYVVEFRSADWQDEEVYEYLRKRGVALAMSDVADKGVTTVEEPLDKDFAYVRIIGKHGVFATFNKARLTDEAMKRLSFWAQKVRHVNNATIFINNNFAGNAPETANYFKKLVGLEPKEWASNLSKFL
jgi:uncharacterized protein YecE (DUF72 family)